MGIAFLEQPPDPSAHCPVSDRVHNNLMYYLPWPWSNDDCGVTPNTVSDRLEVWVPIFFSNVIFLGIKHCNFRYSYCPKESLMLLGILLNSWPAWYPLAKRCRVSVSPQRAGNLPAGAVESAAFHFHQVPTFCCVREGTLMIFSTFIMSLSFSLPFKEKQIPAFQFLHQWVRVISELISKPPLLLQTEQPVPPMQCRGKWQ